jgi:hypothetical protein
VKGRLVFLLPAFLIGFFGCLWLAARMGETVSIHLAFPRDLVVLVFLGWAWMGWKLGVGFWVGPGLRIRAGGPWGAFGVVTGLAIALTFLIYRFGPYRWRL